MGLVLVDLDGTLIPLEAWDPVFYEISATMAGRIGIQPGEFWSLVKALHYQLMRRFSPRAFDWQYLIESVASSFGIYEAPRIEDVLAKYVAGFPVIDGAYEFLRGINDLGLRAAIATNGLRRYQSIVVEALGFSRYIVGLRTSDDYGCVKNCREYFEGASLMIGDNPVFDVYFPKKFGLRTVFVGDWHKAARRYGELLGVDLSDVRPDRAASSLAEALGAVKELTGYL
ncbi:MAG: HAD family hydrolase [Thermoproteus sp.]